jgi:hypothetical protein
MVQRNVGFEFELEDPSVRVFQAGWTKYFAPPKRTRVLTGTDFYVETDYLSGGNASWEFVTTHFPETGPGLLQLQAALTEIDALVNLLRGGAMTQPNQPVAYNPIGANFAAHGPVTPHLYFTSGTRRRSGPRRRSARGSTSPLSTRCFARPGLRPARGCRLSSAMSGRWTISAGSTCHSRICRWERYGRPPAPR